MQRAHKRKIKVLVVDAAMMFAAVQMTVCMHGKQRYTASAHVNQFHDFYFLSAIIRSSVIAL